MSSERPALQASGLSKTFHLHETPWRKMIQLLLGPHFPVRAKTFTALDNVTFTIQAGQSVGIIGVNGSGKSTLLQIIAGTLSPSAGQLAVNGKVAALLELGAGFNPEMTGLENLKMGSQLYGFPESGLSALIEQMVAFAEIGDFIHQPVKTYSSGMFVRLAFALIAHVQADILIVDEALAVGDARFTQKCMRFMQKFLQTGTLIFVSHDMASIRSLCTHCIWLEAGHVRMSGDPKTVGDAYLQSCYAQTQCVTEMQTSQAQLLAASLPKAYASADTSAPESITEDFRLHKAINPLRVLPMTEAQQKGFGAGKARISKVELLDAHGAVLLQSEGGRLMRLRIQALVFVDLQDVIFGYFFRNRLGLNIFGDNTYLAFSETPVSAFAGETLEVDFTFVMPFLPKGEYSVCAALATGTNWTHEQQHWVNDALIISSIDNHVHADVLALPSVDMTIRSSPTYEASSRL